MIVKYLEDWLIVIVVTVIIIITVATGLGVTVVIVDFPWCVYHYINVLLTEIDSLFMCYYLHHNNPPDIKPWNH